MGYMQFGAANKSSPSNLSANPSESNNTSNPSNSDSTSELWVALTINGCIALIIFPLFSYLRPRIKRLYAPRLSLLDTMFPLGKLPSSFFAWFIPAMMANDDDIFFYAGMDALVYIRFMKLCLKISLVILPYGLAVILPLNHYGGVDLTGLDKLTMSNVKEQSPKVWAHLIAVWGYTLIICYLLYEEWKVYVAYRQEFLAKGLQNQYAVFVRDLPSKLQDEESMKGYVEELFPGQVEDVTVVEDLTKWQQMVHKHDTMVLKLEQAKYILEKKSRRPIHTEQWCGEEVDSITFYENQLKKLQDKLEDEMHQEHQILPCAFVIFKSLKTASLAAQVLWDNSPMVNNVTPAPEVNDALWGNLKLGIRNRQFRTIVVWIILFFLVFFWMVPTGFVSSLIALENLQKLIPSLSNLIAAYCIFLVVGKFSPFLRGLIQGFLSSVVLWLFYAILPMVLRFLSKREGMSSKSEVDKSVLGRLFIFKAINQFLFLAIAGSSLNELDKMISAPKQIPVFLARTLPSQSTFFICFIILYVFTGYAIELVRLVPLIVVPIKRYWARTPREEKAAWRPPRMYYDELYADHLLMFMLGLSYSILAPLITPFVLLYFGLGYVVWTYQVLCVYIPKYNSGGQMWPVVFNRMIVGLVLFHLLMIGIFGLKKIITIPLLVLPLPVMTIAFYFVMQQYYLHSSEFLSQEMGSSLSEASPRVLQEVAQSYVRNHSIPSVFAVSTDGARGDDLLNYEEITPSNERIRLLPSPVTVNDEDKVL